MFKTKARDAPSISSLQSFKTLFAPAFKDRASVLTTEGVRVGNRVFNLKLAWGVRGVIKVAFWVGIDVIDGWRNDARIECLNGGYRFDRASRTE